mgnify:FL=1
MTWRKVRLNIINLHLIQTLFQALLQVDKQSYDRLMAAGGIFVGYIYCNGFDALEVNRCYKCNAFSHWARTCKRKMSCLKCSSVHEARDCEATGMKCVNCVRLCERHNLELDTSHAVWDHCCPIYKSVLSNLKKTFSS